MRLQTASSVISLSKELEGDSAKFYEDLAEIYAPQKDTLLGYAKENRKFIVQTERAYYGVITDAIEGCFAFDMESDDFKLETMVADKVSYKETLAQIIKLEELIVKFYTDAAEQSQSLMADLPRAFNLIVKKRNIRLDSLKSV